MNIIYYAAGASENLSAGISSNLNAEVWLNALRNNLPQATIREWQEGDTVGADYAMVWKPPAAMLRERTDLKAIFVLGAGVDAILQLGDNLPAGVPLIRVDDAGMGMQMAEYVSQAVLKYFRRMETYKKLQHSNSWTPLVPFNKPDFSIGVLGLGVLGKNIIETLRHFEFPIHGWSRTQNTIEGVQCYSGQDGLDAFLRATRVLVVILPLTKETENILDYAALSKLKPTSYVINVARGAHIVDEDLLKLIHSGHITGATLDVFREEPLPPQHPFWQEPRISITPHISALTIRETSAQQIALKIAALQRGESVNGTVDRSAGY
jgi:glyoxylate/hydroxypyruvate reductase A